MPLTVLDLVLGPDLRLNDEDKQWVMLHSKEVGNLTKFGLIYSVFFMSLVPLCAQAESDTTKLPVIKSCLDSMPSMGIIPAGVKVDPQFETITREIGATIQITTRSGKFTLDGRACKTVDPTWTFSREIGSWMAAQSASFPNVNDVQKNKARVLSEITRFEKSKKKEDKDELKSLREQLIGLENSLKDALKYNKWVLECSQSSEPNQEIREAATKIITKTEAHSKPGISPNFSNGNSADKTKSYRLPASAPGPAPSSIPAL